MSDELTPGLYLQNQKGELFRADTGHRVYPKYDFERDGITGIDQKSGMQLEGFQDWTVSPEEGFKLLTTDDQIKPDDVWSFRFDGRPIDSPFPLPDIRWPEDPRAPKVPTSYSVEFKFTGEGQEALERFQKLRSALSKFNGGAKE